MVNSSFNILWSVYSFSFSFLNNSIFGFNFLLFLIILLMSFCTTSMFAHKWIMPFSLSWIMSVYDCLIYFISFIFYSIKYFVSLSSLFVYSLINVLLFFKNFISKNCLFFNKLTSFIINEESLLNLSKSFWISHFCSNKLEYLFSYSFFKYLSSYDKLFISSYYLIFDISNCLIISVLLISWLIIVDW